MDISIIIPCYNEVDNVPKIRQELIPVARQMARSAQVEVIFVDDGCTDGTIPALQAALRDEPLEGVTIRYVDHGGNYGLGKALRTGFAAAEGEVVVTTDSDGTYHFEAIPELVKMIRDGEDIVTASPYHPRGGVENVPQYRLVLSRGSSLIYRFLVNWKIHTYTALFRAYRKEVVKQISFTSNGFLGGTELMVKAMLAGYRVVEYPAVLHSRVFGASKAKIARTIRAHLGFQWKVFLHRLGIQRLVEPRHLIGGQTWPQPKQSPQPRKVSK